MYNREYIYKYEAICYEVGEAKYNLKTGIAYYYLIHPASRMPDLQVSTRPTPAGRFAVNVDIVHNVSFILVAEARIFLEDQFQKIAGEILTCMFAKNVTPEMETAHAARRAGLII